MTDPYWTDGQVTLYHGDCRDVAEWLSADVLVTDPPYGIGWKQSAAWKNAYGQGRGSRGHAGIEGDKDTSLREAALDLWGRRSRPAVAFGSLMLEPPRGTQQVLIYAKPADAGVRNTRGGFRRDAEAIYLIGPWPADIGGRSSIIRAKGHVAGPRGTAMRYGHPHAKPVDVMETLITACPPGVIADPFAGAGSTLIAARRQDRRAIGVEIEERYCETAARRLSQGVLTA